MPKLLKELSDDVRFVKSHNLQPKWYKFGKIFVLLGVLAGYYALFGLRKTAIFLGVFLLLSLLVHMLYRIKTQKYTRNWLDFKVGGVDEEGRPARIGAFYYPIILFNAALAVVISQLIKP